MLEELLDKICMELDLPVPKMQNDKSYSLQIAPGIAISQKNLQPGIYFHARVRAMPKEKTNELLTMLMKANMLGQAAFGGTLGLDESGKNITLAFSFPYEIDFSTYKNTLENLVNALCYWQEEIERFMQQKPQPK